MSAISFTIGAKIPGALGRAGTIMTPHGPIETPAFVAVGTKGTVKSLTPEQVRSIGVQVVLGNTYHLYLEPGNSIVSALGGLGRFMNWDGPTMTDSGGFQVFSLGAAYGHRLSKVVKGETEPLLPEVHIEREELPKLVTIDQDGVMFRSHLDGSAHYFTPERAMEIQHELGADMMFAFDECISPSEPRQYQREALDRTHRWARRSLACHEKSPASERQALFGIVQGGRDEGLRRESAKIIGDMAFDGFGIGGSFSADDMEGAVKWSNELLPSERPRHLLGIGEPKDLFMGVEHGVDLFDCVMPTRIARTGMIYTDAGKINLFNAKFRENLERITDDEHDPLYPYTYAYLAHLFRTKEILGIVLASMHNLYFIAGLVEKIRAAILAGTFPALRESFFKHYGNV
ncbi:MAG TPA: tRNA guanosine(34) transglycosylase Tgt [Candidatus Paceibacterota bacterium]|jgi:queuine tRNA-ribosyltransferase